MPLRTNDRVAESHIESQKVLKDGLRHCGFGLFIGFVDNKKNRTGYRQPYPFVQRLFFQSFTRILSL